MNHITREIPYPNSNVASNDSWAPLKTAVSRMALTAEAQKDQVRHFQTAMKGLRVSVDRLGRTCETYLGNLRKIRIRRLRHHSLALAKTMGASLGPRVVG